MPSHVVLCGGCGDVCVLAVWRHQAAGNLVINWSPGPPQHGYRIKMPLIPRLSKQEFAHIVNIAKPFSQFFPPDFLTQYYYLFRECLKRTVVQWWNVCRQFNFAVQVGHQSPSWPKNCGQVHSTGRSARTPTIIFTAFKGKLTNQIKWSLLRFSKHVLFCELHGLRGTQCHW